MAEGKQLLPGFNHNVRHLGQLYHVQTEDSGAASPHVTTHLFLGGNILASKKTGYGEWLGQVDLGVRVQRLMQAQHKEMLRQLVKGAFDEQLAARAARAYAPGELAAEPAPVAEPPAPAPAPTVAAPLAPPPPEPPAPAPEPPRLSRVPRPPAPAPAAASPAPAAPSDRPPAARPATDGWGPPVLPRVPRTPPPPAARTAARAPPPPPAPPPDRRLDELILTYLAEDLGAKPGGR